MSTQLPIWAGVLTSIIDRAETWWQRAMGGMRNRRDRAAGIDMFWRVSSRQDAKYTGEPSCKACSCGSWARSRGVWTGNVSSAAEKPQCETRADAGGIWYKSYCLDCESSERCWKPLFVDPGEHSGTRCSMSRRGREKGPSRIPLLRKGLARGAGGSQSPPPLSVFQNHRGPVDETKNPK